MTAYIECNEGAKTEIMPYKRAMRFAKLLVKVGNYNVKVVRV